jgi:hypothetical protein
VQCDAHIHQVACGQIDLWGWRSAPATRFD